jgi:predicted O-methyltransferase YrrM
MPTFSDGLPFSHATNFLIWLAPFIGKPVCGLEVGSHEGRSALWLLDNILTDPMARLTCVDTWQGEEMQQAAGMDFALKEKNFFENIKPYRNKVSVHKGESRKELVVMAEKLPAWFDFIYIDGSHVAADVLTDAVLSWLILKIGGVLIFDDYTWRSGKGALHDSQMAIDSFTECFAGRYKVLGVTSQVAIQKITD